VTERHPPPVTEERVPLEVQRELDRIGLARSISTLEWPLTQDATVDGNRTERHPPPSPNQIGFVQRELDRVGSALRQPQSESNYAELYAVQQALLWVLEPTGFKSPYDMLLDATPVDGKEPGQGVRGWLHPPY
jgi:hypothetical protein